MSKTAYLNYDQQNFSGGWSPLQTSGGLAPQPAKVEVLEPPLDWGGSAALFSSLQLI